MKIEHSIINMGGMFDITKAHSKFIYQEVTYTYIATGLVREVFRSEDGKSVILITKDYKDYTQQLKEKMISDNKELISLFKSKKVKLISEGKYVVINKLRESSLVIFNHCEFIS